MVSGVPLSAGQTGGRLYFCDCLVFFFWGSPLAWPTLIIVMSVMNGFRAELINRILGLNGHIGVFTSDGQPLEDYDKVSFRLSEIPTIVAATPQVQRPGLWLPLRGMRWAVWCAV